MAVPVEARTHAEFVRGVADAYGDQTAITLPDSGVTYRELNERSAVMARGLLARGVGKGSRVGILLANGPEFAVALFAVTRIGAVAVPLSTFLKPPELARVLRHADLAGLVFQPRVLNQDFVATLTAALPSLSGPELALPEAPYLRWAVVVEGEAPGWARPLTWLTGAPVDDVLLRAVEAEVHPEDVAAMIYTSGQSADPKGVVHTQGGIVGKTHYLASMFQPAPGAERPSSMPFFWVGGLMMDLLMVLEVGGTTVCGGGRTSMGAGPVIGSVTRPHPPHGDHGYRSGLGMSETLAVYGWGRAQPHPDRPLCVPMDRFEPGYLVRVCAPDGTPCPDGVPGEIVVRGPSVTRGLHKVDRGAVFHPDGGYRTGDEGVVEDGALFLLGRLTDMIKTSGANVAPAEVERELVALDGVAAAHVVAVADPVRGQVVAAAIVADDGAELDLGRIRSTLRERLSSYKVPRLAAVLPFDDIPRTPSMKIRKRELAALLRERGTTLDAG